MLVEPKIMLATPYMKIMSPTKMFKIGYCMWEDLIEKVVRVWLSSHLPLLRKEKKDSCSLALKCRGTGIFKNIYGAEYTAKHNLERLRSRSLGMKRSLAIREFALGIEALERFARKDL